MINIFLSIARIIVPLLIIIVTIVNITKTIISGKEDDLKNNWKLLVRRLIAGLIIFIIPSIINYVFTLSTSLKKTANEFTSCFVCLTSSKECDVLLESAKQKEAAIAANHDSKEDEALLRKACEKEQQKKNTDKQSFEEWKKNRKTENSNNTTTNNTNRETVGGGK